MSSENPGKGVMFNGAVTTAPVASLNDECSEYVSGSFHVQTDGTQTVTVVLQVSNVPGSKSGLGPAFVRSEAATSTDYATLSTSTVAAGTGTQNLIIAMPTMPYRSVRLLMNTASGTSQVKAFYRSVGYPS